MPDLDYVTLVGRFGIVVGDGIDVDDEPDVIWCDEGEIRLVPLNGEVKIAGGSPVPWTGGVAVVDANIDADGYLSWRGKQFVQLVDLTSDKVNPTIGSNKATHRVEFRNVKADSVPVSFTSATVRIAADTVDLLTGTCDLTKLLPVQTGNPTPIYSGPRGTGLTGEVVQPTPTTMALELTDGTTTDPIVLPVGPGGSDAGVAGYLADEDSDSRAILDPYLSAKIEAVAETLVRWVNVKEFGAVGNGIHDDTTAIQAAIDEASLTGGIVYFPVGLYRVTSRLQITTSGVRLVGAGENASVIVQSGTMSSIVNFFGTLAPLGSPTAVLTADAGWDNADATIGQTCTVSNASGLAPGDVVVIGDNRATPVGASASAFTTDNSGELQRIKSISGGTITFWGRLRDTYTVARGASIHKVTTINNVGISDLGIQNANPLTSTAKMVEFFACRDVSVSDLMLRDGDNSALNLSYVYGADVDRVKVYDIADDSANGRFGYGVNVGPSEGITVTACRFRRMRHGFSSNGGGTTGRGFAHNVIVSDCISTETTSSAFDTHPGGEVTFIGCQASQVSANPAFAIRSQARIVDCSSSYCNIGIFIQGEVASQVEVVNHSHHHSAGAAIAFYGDSTVGWPKDTRIISPVIRDIRSDAIVLNGSLDGVLVSNAKVQRAGNGTTLQASAITVAGGVQNVTIVGTEAELCNAGVSIGTGTNDVRVSGTRTRRLNGTTPGAVKGSGVGASGVVLHDNLDLDLDGSSDKTLPVLASNSYVYTSSPAGAGTSNALGVGSLRVTPWLLKRPMALSQLGVDIAAASEAGGKMRIGVYKDNSAGYPGDLVIDTGQIAADATGLVFATFSAVTLKPGLYHVGAVVQTVTTTQPTVRAPSNWTPPINLSAGLTLPAANGTVIGWQTGGITGALPSTFPAGAGGSGFAARVIARVA